MVVKHSKDIKGNDNKFSLSVSQWLGLVAVTLGVGIFGSMYAYETFDLEDEVNILAAKVGIVKATEKAYPKGPLNFTLVTLELLNALLVSEPIYREIIEEQQLDIYLVDIYNRTLSDSDYDLLTKEYPKNMNLYKRK